MDSDNEYNEYNELIKFIDNTRDVIEDLCKDELSGLRRYGLIEGIDEEVLRPIFEAWKDVHPKFATANKQIRTIDIVELEGRGLAGAQLRAKIAGHDLALAEWNKAQKPEESKKGKGKLRKLLKWLLDWKILILGSLSSIPGIGIIFEAIKEFLEMIDWIISAPDLTD